MERLGQYMMGSFNSAAQAERDSNYYDITLHMYPIWEGKQGKWMYVEQAVTQAQERPYRQRLYELVKVDANTFESRVYTLAEPKKFIGAWKTPSLFDGLSEGDYTLKAGCEVVLKKQADGTYSGSTGEKSCPSELRGASYATSKVTVHADKIVSWDQGFNADGEQVWGATLGGYEFVKLKN